MKLIQISDTHLTPFNHDLYGLNPAKNLEACVESMNNFHQDSELCVITGDLTNGGDNCSYFDMRKILKKLKMPYHPLIGNHDQREIFSKVFYESSRDVNGFIQKRIKITLGYIILLDTVEDGSDYGAYCEKRENWLNNQLVETGNSPVYIFMHHPPFNIGIPALDKIRIKKGTQKIENVLKKFTNIKHIFFGHLHRNISGSWFGIPYSAVRGTNHQIQLNQKEKIFLNYCHEPPSYSVILLEKKQTTVHYFDFLDKSFYKKMI